MQNNILRVLLLFVCVSTSTVFTVQAQTYVSKDNYFGFWEDSDSWGANIPTYNVSGDMEINGQMSAYPESELKISSGLLSVKDTLYVHGDLFLDQSANMTIANDAVLIVFGNLLCKNKVDIVGDGRVVVTGNLTMQGKGQGSFSSDRDPALVFVGGSVNVPKDKDDYPVFFCGDDYQKYDDSDCGWGTLEDLDNSPEIDLNKLVTCGGGFDPGVIALLTTNPCNNSTVLFSGTEATSGQSDFIYQWFVSDVDVNPEVNFAVWTELAGKTEVNMSYDLSTSVSTLYFVRKATKNENTNCVVFSNIVETNITDSPDPEGVYHD